MFVEFIETLNDRQKSEVFMKRQISFFMIFAFALILSSGFPISADESRGNEFHGQDSEQTESEKIEKEWSEIGEQGKKALSEAGKFFSDAGRKALSETKKALNETLSETGKALSDAYDEAMTPECYGKWIYKDGKNRTIIECDENGEMQITQKSGGKTKKWSGVFTATSRAITFSIKKSSESENVGKTWFFAYSLQEGGDKIKFQCSSLFSSSVLFEKYHLFA